MTYAKKYLTLGERKGGSKAQLILSLLGRNENKAWFSTDIAKVLKIMGSQHLM